MQSALDLGGELHVDRTCTDIDQLVVSKPIRMTGGTLEVPNGLEIADGGRLEMVDGASLAGHIQVDNGGDLWLHGAGIEVRGDITIDPGGSMAVQGYHTVQAPDVELTAFEPGARTEAIDNHGWIYLSGLVFIGDQAGGIAGQFQLDQHWYVEVGELDPASRIWFDEPPKTAAEVFDVAGFVAGGLGAGVELTTAFQSVSSNWEVSSRVSTQSLSLVTLVRRSETFDLAREIDRAAAGAVITVPEGYQAGAPVEVAGLDHTPRSVTLKGGSVVRSAKGAMFVVPAGSRLNLADIELDGGGVAGACDPQIGPIVEVQAARGSLAAGVLVVGAGAVLRNNASHGVVNYGELWLDGQGATISGNVFDTACGNPAIGPVGGGGVWNTASGTAWLVNGAISANQVTGQTVRGYGGGVLNQGLMRLAGATIQANTASYAGGGVAVVRQAGAEQGGRLEIGTYQVDPASTGPVIAGNTARYGGGLAVVDSADWGGPANPVPDDQPASGAPYAEIYNATLQSNSAAVGGAIWASGGAALRFTGTVTVAASNRAEQAGTAGIVIENAFAGLAGQVKAAAGVGFALLDPAWPLWVEKGFNQSATNPVVIETVAGLQEGASVPVVKVVDNANGLRQEQLDSFTLALPVGELQSDGVGSRELVAVIPSEPHSPVPSPTPTWSPTPTTSPSPSKSPTPTTSPSPTPTKSPSPTPTPSQTPSPTPTTSSPPPLQVSGPTGSASPSPSSTQRPPMTGPDDDQTSGSATPSATATSSRTATPSVSPSATVTDSPSVTPTEPSATPSQTPTPTPPPESSTPPAATPSGGGPTSGDSGPSATGAVTLADPPPGTQMQALGFSLIALGTLGLVGLAAYVLLRRSYA
jgi:hypothetical protein